MRAYKLNKGSFILKNKRTMFLCYGVNTTLDKLINTINEEGISIEYKNTYGFRCLCIICKKGKITIPVYKRINKVELLELGCSF